MATGNWVGRWLGITSGSTSSTSVPHSGAESLPVAPPPVIPTIDGELMPRQLLLPPGAATPPALVFTRPLEASTATEECLESFVPIFCSSGDPGGRNLGGGGQKVSVRARTFENLLR